MKVWIDERVVPANEARIPVTDHGFLYGDGIFEGMRMYARRVFRPDDHYARLAVSAKAIGLEIPGGLANVRRIVEETCRAWGEDDAYIRLVISRGEGALGVDPTTCPTPRIVCIVDSVRLYSEEKLRTGLDLVTSSWRRPPPDVLDPRVKSLNYLNNALAKLEAKRRGADEALLLNQRGTLAEASVANVFSVTRGALATPPPSDGALEGITRMSVLELAAAAGLRAEERTLGRVDLFGADEVFLTGSGARIVPVRSLDGEVIGSGKPGPITAQLSEAFDRFARGFGTPLW